MGRHVREDVVLDDFEDDYEGAEGSEGLSGDDGHDGGQPSPLETWTAPEPAGPFAAGPWSGSVTRDAAGELRIAGLPVSEIVRRHGTPMYLVDEVDMRGRARSFREAFEARFTPENGLNGVDVYYAGKAFLSVTVARWMAQEGLCVDTSSGGELAVALRAGVPGDRIGLHGNNKSPAEIEAALRSGVGRIVVDSLPEIDLVANIAADLDLRAPVMVRVTTGVHAGGHSHIATAHEDQKFGLSLTSGAARNAVDEILANGRLELLGLHSHIGSQILDLEAFGEAADRVLGLRAEIARDTGVLVPEVDLGGGFGISYTGKDDAPPTPDEAADALAGAVLAACQKHGTPPPRISIEPGRAIAGPAGMTLYTVGTVKEVEIGEERTRTYVSVDGGMSDNMRPALYDADYTATLATRVSDAPAVASRVVGKHCESGDIVVKDVALPSDVLGGDLLAVPATGAYGRSMASNYNMVPRPPVVSVRDGETRVIVRRETIDDLLALDEG